MGSRPVQRSNNRRAIRTAAGRQALTLLEVLAVVAIIALLVAILLGSLGRAREQARGTVCLSNLHQMVMAAHAYTTVYTGSYPPNQDTVYTREPTTGADQKIDYGWDITRIIDMTTGSDRVLPGLIWQGRTIEAVHQCPSFKGAAMWADDRYTGYNYNSSYIGAFRKKKEKASAAAETGPAATPVWVVVVRPARQEEIRTPALCAVFGDGQYAAGANKFMRSPWGSEQGARDSWFNSGRGAGTQGYRHAGRTNVGFADGHARTWGRKCTDTYESEKPFIGEGNGFLSPDNSLYDLR